ncbi:hypothetical protein A2914_02175 [Candidatus Nomurabacteria bacterium RIFCSPLOWO2_01_FULL_41_21]|uniref:Uncharacterized protein n=2 Tax=Candidatus Nomuraibacteriota TaxID=1752729 RepID=A0A1F6V382_9BACT|nr:MAG: hypothetical protein A2733_01565 [Candidatus Nomurabacteria bacterium RIFCSPHIGHO2_01_FULL_40_20]OGI88737.1 MAG: hypothetical protein A2914_02175 [Candidatus Nomurabacteria bacterium RIFCSPLOWO2_01_FULL_41_21]
MDLKDLNKSQLILLAILLSFVISIATGITTVTLMEQAPESVTIPVTQIVRETVEKIVPGETIIKTQELSAEQKKLLEDLKAIKPLVVTLFLKGANADGSEDKILGTGLFLGDNKVVIASVIEEPKEGEVYVVKSILGEQKVSKITVEKEKDFTIVELAKPETIPPPNPDPNTDTDTSPPPPPPPPNP